MIDTYISHPDKAALEIFAANFMNFIPVHQGQAAIAADNTATPPTSAQAAKGDPALFYTCIRATFDISSLVQSPFSVVDAVTGSGVVGVFA